MDIVQEAISCNTTHRLVTGPLIQATFHKPFSCCNLENARQHHCFSNTIQHILTVDYQTSHRLSTVRVVSLLYKKGTSTGNNEACTLGVVIRGKLVD